MTRRGFAGMLAGLVVALVGGRQTRRARLTVTPVPPAVVEAVTRPMPGLFNPPAAVREAYRVADWGYDEAWDADPAAPRWTDADLRAAVQRLADDIDRRALAAFHASASGVPHPPFLRTPAAVPRVVYDEDDGQRRLMVWSC